LLFSKNVNVQYIVCTFIVFKLSRFALGMSGDLQQRYDFFLNKGVRMTFDKLFKGFLLHQFLLKKIIIQQVIIR
jgi:hypothetical protein